MDAAVTILDSVTGWLVAWPIYPQKSWFRSVYGAVDLSRQNGAKDQHAGIRWLEQ